MDIRTWALRRAVDSERNPQRRLSANSEQYFASVVVTTVSHIRSIRTTITRVGTYFTPSKRRVIRVIRWTDATQPETGFSRDSIHHYCIIRVLIGRTSDNPAGTPSAWTQTGGGIRVGCRVSSHESCRFFVCTRRTSCHERDLLWIRSRFIRCNPRKVRKITSSAPISIALRTNRVAKIFSSFRVCIHDSQTVILQIARRKFRYLKYSPRRVFGTNFTKKRRSSIYRSGKSNLRVIE